MTMDLLQPKKFYRLEVGLVDASGNFELVSELNNSSTGTESRSVDFSGHEVSGKRIAFRNTLYGSANYDYSYNYIDNITLKTTGGVQCVITELPYSEDFEACPISTGSGAYEEPECWGVITPEAPLTDATRPQINYSSTSGNRSLRMINRCVYAMPALSEGVSGGNLTMTMDLLQPKKFYRLEVGLVDADNTFELVAELNNSSTGTETRSIDFSGHEVSGKRIAFRNTLYGSANYDYSYNYIDNITISGDNVVSQKADGNTNDVVDVERYLENIAVYPNPTTGMLHIEAVDVQKVECYSQMGQLVGVYDHADELNISEFSNGVYMLRITVPQGVTVRKVVKR